MNFIEELGFPDRFSKTFCLEGLDRFSHLADAIKNLSNVCAENGYRISKANNSTVLDTPESGTIDNRTQRKVVFTFEKIKPPTTSPRNNE